MYHWVVLRLLLVGFGILSLGALRSNAERTPVDVANDENMEQTTPTLGIEPQTLAEVLTVDELATLLRVERKTAYAAVARGEIPGVRRVGRSIRVCRRTVLRWLSEGQGRAPRSRRRP